MNRFSHLPKKDKLLLYVSGDRAPTGTAQSTLSAEACVDSSGSLLHDVELALTDPYLSNLAAVRPFSIAAGGGFQLDSGRVESWLPKIEESGALTVGTWLRWQPPPTPEGEVLLNLFIGNFLFLRERTTESSQLIVRITTPSVGNSTFTFVHHSYSWEATIPQKLADGEWHHVAFTTAKGVKPRLYVNGTANDAAEPDPFDASVRRGALAVFLLGLPYRKRQTEVQIAQTVIYKAYLSEAEIKGLMTDAPLNKRLTRPPAVVTPAPVPSRTRIVHPLSFSVTDADGHQALRIATTDLTPTLQLDIKNVGTSSVSLQPRGPAPADHHFRLRFRRAALDPALLKSRFEDTHHTPVQGWSVWAAAPGSLGAPDGVDQVDLVIARTSGALDIAPGAVVSLTLPLAGSRGLGARATAVELLPNPITTGLSGSLTRQLPILDSDGTKLAAAALKSAQQLYDSAQEQLANSQKELTEDKATLLTDVADLAAATAKVTALDALYRTAASSSPPSHDAPHLKRQLADALVLQEIRSLNVKFDGLKLEEVKKHITEEIDVAKQAAVSEALAKVGSAHGLFEVSTVGPFDYRVINDTTTPTQLVLRIAPPADWKESRPGWDKFKVTVVLPAELVTNGPTIKGAANGGLRFGAVTLTNDGLVRVFTATCTTAATVSPTALDITVAFGDITTATSASGRSRIEIRLDGIPGIAASAKTGAAPPPLPPTTSEKHVVEVERTPAVYSGLETRIQGPLSVGFAPDDLAVVSDNRVLAGTFFYVGEYRGNPYYRRPPQHERVEKLGMSLELNSITPELFLWFDGGMVITDELGKFPGSTHTDYTNRYWRHNGTSWYVVEHRWPELGKPPIVSWLNEAGCHVTPVPNRSNLTASARIAGDMSVFGNNLTLGSGSGRTVLNLHGGADTTKLDGSCIFFSRGGSARYAIGNYEAIFEPNNTVPDSAKANGDLTLWSTTNTIIPQGNVGIGTTTTGSALQVNGGVAVGYAASTAAPANGITVSGNIGIGTTTPGAKLDVRGNLQIGSDPSGHHTISAYSKDGAICAQLFAYDGLGGYVGTRTSHPLTIRTGDLDRITIDASGNVGIGLPTPTRAKLHVAPAATIYSMPKYRAFSYAANDSGAIENNKYPGYYSIWADAHVATGTGFFVESDARLKELVAHSDSNADLKRLTAIEIVDYRYRDAVQHGSAVHKKVFAQQLETVLPDAVNRCKGVIPDILALARADDGWVALKTDLAAGERVKIILDEAEKVLEVLETRADGFRVDLDGEIADVFVYGREVEDLRVVDYDAIAMLNVSATQELARLVREKDAEIAALRDRLAESDEAIQALNSQMKLVLDELAALRARDRNSR